LQDLRNMKIFCPCSQKITQSQSLFDMHAIHLIGEIPSKPWQILVLKKNWVRSQLQQPWRLRAPGGYTCGKF
jgi:hypothetical protein